MACRAPEEGGLIAEAGLLEEPPPGERASIEAARRQLADKLLLVERRALAPAGQDHVGRSLKA